MKERIVEALSSKEFIVAVAVLVPTTCILIFVNTVNTTVNTVANKLYGSGSQSTVFAVKPDSAEARIEETGVEAGKRKTDEGTAADGSQQEDDNVNAPETDRSDGSAKNQNAKIVMDRKRIGIEFDARYRSFKERIAERDPAGAVGAFDLPQDRYRSAYPDLANRDSASLLRELNSAADIPKVWPPRYNDSLRSIRNRIDTFMLVVRENAGSTSK